MAECDGGGAVVVAFHYTSGEAMAYAAITLQAPGESAPGMGGRTDVEGRFVFLPDRDGLWTVIADDGMGHVATATVSPEGGALIPRLLSVPAKVHFLSCEPLLGPLDLTRYLGKAGARFLSESDKESATGIDWVIGAGEKTVMGEGARRMDAAWIRSLRDQCAASRPKTGFNFKQWGNFDAAGIEVGADKAGFELDGHIHHDFPRLPGSKGKGRPRSIDSLPADDPRYMADRIATGRARKALAALSDTDREWVEGIGEKVRDANPERREILLRAIRRVLSRVLVDPESDNKGLA